MITPPGFRGHAHSSTSNASDPEAQLERIPLEERRMSIRSRPTSVRNCARGTVATFPSSTRTLRRGTALSRIGSDLTAMASMVIPERPPGELASSNGDSAELRSAPDLTYKGWFLCMAVIAVAIIGLVFESRKAASASN